MARLITKFKYMKPGKQQGKKSRQPGGYAKYIGTREGVEKIDDSKKNTPSTTNQQKIIRKILKDFPDSKDMHEYSDYLKSPTAPNASEFISRALEDNSYEAAWRDGTENSHGSHAPHKAKPQQPKKPFELPAKNDNMRRLFAYLLFTRGLDKSVVQEFVKQKMLYESKNYHNAVFVGYDQSGTAQHAHERGTITGKPFKHNIPSSKPEYSFHWNGTSSYLFLFEAPIDMLSFISMHSHQNWQQHSYAAACSVSDKVLSECLKNAPQIKYVYLCFDNDAPGQQANKRISDKLKETHPEIKTQILIPFNKDWNEDLLMRNHGGAEQCQAQLS